jgi:Peptidase family M1 domain
MRRVVSARAAATGAVLAAGLVAGCSHGGGGATPGGGKPAAAAARWPDKARYVLALRYDPQTYAVAGSERISFVNTGPATLRSVWLRTWANAYGSCTRRYAQVQLASGGTAGAQREGCTALEVRLAHPLEPGARTTIALVVRISVPPHADRFGRMGDVAFFGNGIPLLAVDDRGGWHLPPYTDRGESFFSLTSSWQVELRLPRQLSVASTGTETSTRDDGPDRVVALAAPRARDFALVVGRLRMSQIRADGVRIRRFTRPGTSGREVRSALRTARAALRAYGDRFGRYDQPEIDLVDGPAEVANGGLAMEYPELVLTPAWPPALVHELAHQWWFRLVGDDQWTEPWLDESFAEYSAASLPNSIGGPDRLGLCGELPPKRPPLTSSMATFAHAPPKLYSRSVYVAGACMLRRLERGLGRAEMNRFLRSVIGSHGYGVLTTAEFVAALRKAAPATFDVDRWLREAKIETRRG